MLLKHIWSAPNCLSLDVRLYIVGCPFSRVFAFFVQTICFCRRAIRPSGKKWGVMMWGAAWPMPTNRTNATSNGPRCEPWVSAFGVRRVWDKSFIFLVSAFCSMWFQFFYLTPDSNCILRRHPSGQGGPGHVESRCCASSCCLQESENGRGARSWCRTGCAFRNLT